MIVSAVLLISSALISAAGIPKNFLASKEAPVFDLPRCARLGAWAETAAAFPKAPARALSYARALSTAAAQSLDAAWSPRLRLGSVGSRVARA